MLTLHPVKCDCHKWIQAGSGGISLKATHFQPSTLDMVTLRIAIFLTPIAIESAMFAIVHHVWVLHGDVCVVAVQGGNDIITLR